MVASRAEPDQEVDVQTQWLPVLPPTRLDWEMKLAADRGREAGPGRRRRSSSHFTSGVLNSNHVTKSPCGRFSPPLAAEKEPLSFLWPVPRQHFVM